MKRLPVVALALVALTALCVLIDGFVAGPLEGAELRRLVNPIVTVIEYAFGFPVSKWLTGFVLLLAAIALFLTPRWRPLGWPVLFVASSQLTTRLIAGVLKNVFERHRPYQALAGPGFEDRWFVEGGSSFPSGHAAHFWGLFFALAIVFPRTRIPALVLALFVSLSRVLVNDHYVSDVVGSAAIAALVTWGYAAAFRRRLTAPAAVSSGSPLRDYWVSADVVLHEPIPREGEDAPSIGYIRNFGVRAAPGSLQRIVEEAVRDEGTVDWDGTEWEEVDPATLHRDVRKRMVAIDGDGIWYASGRAFFAEE